MIDVKVKYFTGKGIRVPREDISKAKYIQLQGKYGNQSIDEFYELPGRSERKNYDFIAKLLRHLEAKYDVRKFYTYFYKSDGRRVLKDRISDARYFSVKLGKEEIFFDEFPKRLRSKDKLEYVKIVLDHFRIQKSKARDIKIEDFKVEDEQGFVNVKYVPMVSKISTSSRPRVFENVKNSELNGLSYKPYSLALSYSGLHFEELEVTYSFIKSEVDRHYKSLINFRNNETGLKGKEQEFLWRIIIEADHKGELEFTFSSSIAYLLDNALIEIQNHLEEFYSNLWKEKYGYTIHAYSLKRIRVVMYDLLDD